MIISASKLLTVAWYSTVNFIITLPLSLPILFFVSSSFLDLVIIIACFSVATGSVVGIISNFDIEVVEDDDGMIGGAPTYGYMRDSLPRRFRRRQFVTQESLDIALSQNRNLFDRIFGRYQIYNKEGLGFVIQKYCFLRKDFKQIQSHLDKVLGFSIS